MKKKTLTLSIATACLMLLTLASCHKTAPNEEIHPTKDATVMQSVLPDGVYADTVLNSNGQLLILVTEVTSHQVTQLYTVDKNNNQTPLSPEFYSSYFDMSYALRDYMAIVEDYPCVYLETKRVRSLSNFNEYTTEYTVIGCDVEPGGGCWYDQNN